MSRFFSSKFAGLTPYTPGEQPADRRYIKLNTNESPFPPSEKAVAAAAEAASRLQLYPDPDGKALCAALADTLGVLPSQVVLGNGSDEILNFAFMAFCDAAHPAYFADITYGFYKVFAAVNGVPYQEIPLKEDFSLDVADYFGKGGPVFIANPNAPTGLAVPLSDIERLLQENPDRVVVVDEAYVDFGGDSAVSLINKYDNLLVTGTFSKSRSMAGARLGFGVANEALVADLNTLRYSLNPYNINRMTMAAGLGMLADQEAFERNRRAVMATRERTTAALRDLGFILNDSATNFLFARHPRIGGEALYRALKERGILVRHFAAPRLTDYNRITVGSDAEMDTLILTLKELLL